MDLCITPTSIVHKGADSSRILLSFSQFPVLHLHPTLSCPKPILRPQADALGTYSVLLWHLVPHADAIPHGYRSSPAMPGVHTTHRTRCLNSHRMNVSFRCTSDFSSFLAEVKFIPLTLAISYTTSATKTFYLALNIFITPTEPWHH